MIARWTDGLWYEGRVDRTRGAERHVVFGDGVERWVRAEDIALGEDAAEDLGGTLAVGTRVFATWSERHGRVWNVAYDMRFRCIRFESATSAVVSLAVDAQRRSIAAT